MATSSIPVFVSDFTKLPEAILIDLINFDNGTSLTPSLLSFGSPHALANDTHLRNTSLQVTANPISNYTGSVVVYYNRIDLSVVPGVRSVDFLLPDTVSMVSDIIALINSRFSIRLTSADYQNDTLTELTDSFVQLAILAEPTSLVWINSLNIRIKRAVSSTVDLSNLLTVRDLDVFVYVPPVTP